MANENRMSAKQVTIDDQLERRALRCILQLWLVRDGWSLPAEFRGREHVLETDRIATLIACLELLGGFEPDGAQAAIDRLMGH